MDHQDFMREAIRLSVRNVEEGLGGPFAALVVQEGKVIGSGTNLVTSTNDPTAHAEVVAIRNACKELGSFQLTGCDFYSSCEPCPMCLGALYWARPSRIFYANTKADAAAIGFDDRFIYQEFSLPPGSRTIPQQQILQDEALIAFRIWKEKEDKISY